MDGDKRGAKGASLVVALAVLVVGWPSCLMLGLQACAPDSALLGGGRVRVRSTRDPAPLPPGGTSASASPETAAQAAWLDSGADLWATQWPVGLAGSPTRRKWLAAAFEGQYRAGPRPPYTYEYTAGRGGSAASGTAGSSGEGPAPYPSSAGRRPSAPAPVLRDDALFAEPPQSAVGLSSA